MTDVHSKEVRSYNMSRIRSKDTKPELLVRKYLFSQGFRFRLHDKNMAGKPDIILPKYKSIIFIHGCFWHGHEGCHYFVVPKTRTDWWLNKINNNAANDRKSVASLQQSGWRVFEIWECDLKKNKLEQTLTDLTNKIRATI